MSIYDIKPNETRTTEQDILPLLLERWSPRALSGDPVTVSDIETLVEAARWSPSCFNAQPWRFAYVLRDTREWQPLFQTLAPANQSWVARAGAIIAIATRTRYEHNDEPADTHSFDGGAAWMSLALQARTMNLIAHGMQGFDPAEARQVLSLPEPYDLPALIAIGQPGRLEDLSPDQQARELPSSRKPLVEILSRNNFKSLES